MATVDVVIPCYRYGHFLRECVESVLSQSIADVRILIIDDASPDGSADVARELAAADPRIELSLHSINQGQTATYNEGIAWASAPYFLLLSADDRLAPGALERAVAIMAEQPEIAMTYGECVLEISGERQKIPIAPHRWVVRDGRDFLEEVCGSARNPVFTPTVVVRTAVQKRIGGYLASLPHTCDMEMWLRFAANGRVAFTPSLQAVYRVHGANMSAGYLENVVSDYAHRAAAFETFFATEGRRMPDADRLRGLARRRLAAAAFWTGVAQWLRGRRATGAKLLSLAFGLDPRMRLAPPLAHLTRLSRFDRRPRVGALRWWSRLGA